MNAKATDYKGMTTTQDGRHLAERHDGQVDEVSQEMHDRINDYFTLYTKVIEVESEYHILKMVIEGIEFERVYKIRY